MSINQIVRNSVNASIANVPMPKRIAKLPINDKGFPIPAFVAWLEPDAQRYVDPRTPGARRDFRVIDHRYMDRCFQLNRCWICEEPLGRHRVFAIGPMCTVNRVTMEPPNHRECAEYAARACPFMLKPKMRRNRADELETRPMPGIHFDRNPGVFCLYETETYRRFMTSTGPLCQLGQPQRVDWWTEGRASTRAEVLEAIDSGMPLLRQAAVKEGKESMVDLDKARQAVNVLLPIL